MRSVAVEAARKSVKRNLTLLSMNRYGPACPRVADSDEFASIILGAQDQPIRWTAFDCKGRRSKESER
jgi:hypothetical protein